MYPALMLLLAALPSGQPTGPSVSVPPLVALPGDEAALKAVALPSTPTALLDFFRRRTCRLPPWSS